MNKSAPRAGAENPRTRRVRQLILDSAIELLLSGGAREVTAARIAEETGVARTTIYRQWPDQPSLLLATIDALVAPHFPTPGSGDLEDDLTTALTNLRTRLVTRQVRPVLAALFDYATRDDAFVSAQRRFVEGLIQPTVDVLESARGRGELPATLDCSMTATTLTGPLLQRFFLMQETIGDELIDETIARFMRSQPAP